MPAPKLKSASAVFTEKAAGPQVCGRGRGCPRSRSPGPALLRILLPPAGLVCALGDAGEEPALLTCSRAPLCAVVSASGCRRWDPPALKASVVLRTEVQGRTFVFLSSQLCSLPGRCHLPYRLSEDQEGEPPVPKVCSAGASFLWSPGRQQPVLDFFLRALPPGTRCVRNGCDTLARSSPARLSGAASAHPGAALTWEQRAVGQQGGSSGGSRPPAGVA